MDRYKFRGKRLHTGEWVCGSLIIYPGGKHEIYVPFEPGDETTIRHTLEKVDPATAGQYTGLKDKNGVGIYEGDIVRIGATRGQEVFFHDGSFCLKGIGEEPLHLSLYLTQSHLLDVIGNIHDNPDLLKEGA